MQKKIFVIYFDENILAHELIKTNLLLHAEKYVVKTVSKFEDLLKEISSNNFDVVLSEIETDKISTNEIISGINKVNPAIPVIFVAGKLSEEANLSEEIYKADDLVSKNDLRRLDFAITKSLQNKYYKIEKFDLHQEISKYQIYFEHLFLSSPVAIVMLDAEDRIINANQKFLEIFQYELEEVKGRNIHSLIIPDDLKFEALVFSNHVRTGNYLHKETRRKRKDGTDIFVDIIAQPAVVEGKITGILGMYVDVTQRKLAEIELQNAKEKAEEADKLKSEFLAQMSHEIRTPINTILNFTSLLQEEFFCGENEEADVYFESIHNSGRRIIRTIDLLLNMSEIQSETYEFAPKEFDLHTELLEDVIFEAERIAKQKGIDLQLKLKTDDLKIYADEYSVYQILNNLIDNAIKFTHKGKVEIEIGRENKDLLIEVKDTGVGISKEYLPYLFTPFSQEERGYTRKFEGNGLGLALVKRYCEMNNAKIEVQSEKGNGTKFQVAFLNKDIRKI